METQKIDIQAAGLTYFIIFIQVVLIILKGFDFIKVRWLIVLLPMIIYFAILLTIFTLAMFLGIVALITLKRNLNGTPKRRNKR